MKKSKPMHGTSKAKGCSHARLGNFCKMFPKLESWADECKVTEQCEARDIAAALGGFGGIMHDVNSSSNDSSIPAAYTFFAQFVDHDITLDTTSDLHGDPISTKEVGRLPNLRSASLDLDSIYGFGPEASPYLYDQEQTGRLLIGNDENKNDLPRNKDGRALIGDPRNDENLFLSQMQLLFLKFHNRRMIGRSFEEVQTDVRFHYQWIVLYDFLERICDENIYKQVINNPSEFPKYDIKDKCGRICMPVEFSVAAFRFGHTLVRSQYPVNVEYPVVDLFDERFGTEGFSAVPESLTVDWRFLLDVECCHDYVKSKAFDHLFVDELIRLPDPVVGRFTSDNDRSLAFRNLLRAYALGLPSGQAVANEIKAKGYSIPDNRPDISALPGWKCLEPSLQKKLTSSTPLFLYLMAEAGDKDLGNGDKLGPVGSAILLEVFITTLKECESILNPPKGYKGWKPDKCIAKDGRLTLADIVRYVN